LLDNKTDTKIISKPAGPEATIENGMPSLMYSQNTSQNGRLRAPLQDGVQCIALH